MTTLEDATTASSVSTRLVGRVARGLGRFSRRGFLVQTAVVGSALAVDAKGYVLRPQTAASTVCGPDAACSDGYTVMCCTINHGVNACPPGTFAAGWWKAADSSWCCGGYRYITDCNATCRDCTSGCSGDHICDKGCWSCSCKCGSTATCDQRRVCCNAFRYGQCNTQVKCSGGVACRVVSCVPPYSWSNCTTTSLSDNSTAEHNAPCLQGCGPILKEYDRLGANGSSLGASVGPERAVGDGRGRYVTYQHGSIYWTSSTGAHRVSGGIEQAWVDLGAGRGVLGYPTGDMYLAEDGRGYLQDFEHGTLVRAPGAVARRVTGAIRTEWVALGRETGAVGYPTGDMRATADRHGYEQSFQKGVIIQRSGQHALRLTGTILAGWLARGAETGLLGYPVAEMARASDGQGYLQEFQVGLLVHAPGGTAHRVTGGIRERWLALGQVSGVLGYPTADMTATAGGWHQEFASGVLSDGPSTDAFVVRGAVLDAWTAAGAEAGRWGFPLEDTVVADDGSAKQRFEGGVLRA